MRIPGAAALLLVFLIGCLGAQAPQEEGEPPLTAVPSPPQEGGLSINILIADSPRVALLNETAVISWRILADAPVNITTTTLQYGPTSIPGTLGPGDSPDDVGYPHAVRKLAAGSSRAPGSFFAEVIPQRVGTMFFRVHALVEGKNFWSSEHAVEVAERPVVRFTYTPVTSLTGEWFTLAWQASVPFSPRSFSTRIYYGGESQAGDFDAGPQPPAGYPLRTEAFSKPDGGVVNTFRVIARHDEVGPLYLRAYAEVDGKSYWSKEREIVIKESPHVAVLSYPEEGNISGPYTFRWRVAGGDPGIIEETGILWGPRKGQVAEDYVFRSRALNGRSPRIFQDSFYISYGGLITHFRAYAVVDGAYYYSEEYSLESLF